MNMCELLINKLNTKLCSQRTRLHTLKTDSNFKHHVLLLCKMEVETLSSEELFLQVMIENKEVGNITVVGVGNCNLY